MSLSTDALLFAIALILFGIWIEDSGIGGGGFTLAGLTLAAVAVLGSLVWSLHAASRSSESAERGD